MAKTEVQLTLALVLTLFVSLANTSNCQHTLDLITVLDGSESIRKGDFTKLKSAVTDLVDGLNVSTGNQRVGAVVFSSNVSTKISLGYNTRLIKSRISHVKQPKEGTRTYLGILGMTEIFQSQNRPGARKVGIVFTDGRSSSLSKTRKAAQKAKEAGIVMLAVGVGTKVNKSELQSIASSPSYVLELSDFNALQDSISSLIQTFCHQRPIKVDGAWSSWSTIAYERCSGTCGGGTRTVIRSRNCTNPSPSDGGKCCKGSAIQIVKKRCNTQPCSVCKHKLDLITVLDGSGSIPKNDFIKLKSAVTDLVDGLNVSTGNQRVGAVVFSSKVSTKISLGYNARLIKSRISRIKQPKGKTRTYLGIRGMTKIFRRQNRPGARKVGIVFTDGQSRSLSKTRKAAAKAKAAGIIMFAVGVGTKINKNELRTIASSPSYVMELSDFSALQNTISSLVKRVCQDEGTWSSWSTSTYGRCSVTCGGGTRTIIRTRTCTSSSPGDKRCTGSVIQRKKKRCNTQRCPVCKHKLDLITVLDGSGSIPKNDFIKLKSAVTDLVDGLNVSTGNQRVGAVVFSSKVSTKISLGYNARLIKSRISRIKQPKGKTRTHLGIRGMTKIFRRQNRPGARKVGIVITDGRSGSLSKTRKAAAKAKAAGIVMFAVGVGTKINKKELRAIASSPSYVMELSDFSALQNTISSLVKRVCQVEGTWSSWSTSTYGRCSATCGGGTRTIIRTRTCTDSSPGDNRCTGSVIQRKKKRCNTQRCPVNGRWSRWRVRRGPCSASCGGGKRIITKSRTCMSSSPNKYSKTCVGRSRKTYRESCNNRKCPVNSRWRITRRRGRTRTFIRVRTCNSRRLRRRGKRCIRLGRKRIRVSCNRRRCRYG